MDRVIARVKVGSRMCLLSLSHLCMLEQCRLQDLKYSSTHVSCEVAMVFYGSALARLNDHRLKLRVSDIENANIWHLLKISAVTRRV